MTANGNTPAAAPVDVDDYLTRCIPFIEADAVRAALVALATTDPTPLERAQILQGLVAHGRAVERAALQKWGD